MILRWAGWIALGAMGSVALRAAADDAGPSTVITSDRARVLEKGRSMEFEGRVRLTRGTDSLSADRLVTREANTRARAWGRVYLRREGTAGEPTWEAWGDRGVYDTEASSGTLWGIGRPARAVRTGASTEEGRMRVEAPTITLWSTRASASVQHTGGRARGGVYIRGEETVPVGRTTELWADAADYDGASGGLALTGAFPGTIDPPAGFPRAGELPFARQRQGREVRELEGRRIVYRLDDRRLSVREQVAAWLVFETGADAATIEDRSRRGRDRAPAR